MPRARDPNRNKAFELYKESNGKMLLKDIAEQLGKSDSQIRKWKNQDKWDEVLKGNVTKSKSNVTNGSKGVKVVTDEPPKKDGRVKKRSGNPNPQNQFTKRNKAAMIHGLRSKFFFPEQIEIMEALQDFDIVDQIWLQIEISFSAIIRAQKIMWVEDPFDHLKEVSGEMSGETISKTDYKVVYAHERYESYIKAQSRAMAEYRNLIKQFLDLTTEDDERRLKLEQMQLAIDKTKAEIKQMTNESESSTKTIIINDKEEMRRLMNERERNQRAESD